ncbi:MAG: 2,3-bisphosphoglycerate-independent phosphoglycerate mutase [Candidatus Woykebacteria bacterium]
MPISSNKAAKPLIIIILDGWGVAAENSSNAITLARKPNMDSYYSSFPHTELLAAGTAVGLPTAESGNSEVGHLNLGAGRVVYQDLERINMAIADGSFLENEVLKSAIEHATKNKSKVHLLGLVGSGAVHSSLEHLYALLWLLKSLGVPQAFMHLFTDGRDSPPSSALRLVTELSGKLKEIGYGEISSVSGRYYAMDRDNRWERTSAVYRRIVNGEGRIAQSAPQVIEDSYKNKITDEFVEPTLVAAKDKGPTTIKDNDAVIFFNFRPDRARQLTKAIVSQNFPYFDRGQKLNNVFFVTMTEYEKGLPCSVAFPAPKVNFPIAQVISESGFRQLHISETEKYAHVTYFFNGGVEGPFVQENRIHLPSPRVATYDLKPEMSAELITDTLLQKLRGEQYDFYVVNFANADMVAHTGSLEATIQAVEFLDKCVGRIVLETLSLGGAVVITGDHGNAEQMRNLLTGEVDTEHSSNPVPFLALTESLRRRPDKLQSGVLADIAPTILFLLKLQKPNVMTGRNLLAQY